MLADGTLEPKCRESPGSRCRWRLLATQSWPGRVKPTKNKLAELMNVCGAREIAIVVSMQTGFVVLSLKLKDCSGNGKLEDEKG